MGGQIYSKRVLIPLWIIQLIALAAEAGLNGYGFYLAHKAEENDGYINGTYIDSDSLDTYKISAGIVVGFEILTIILTFIEIGLFGAHKLKPGAFVILTTLKTIIWAAFSALAINAVVDGYVAAWGLVLPLVLFLTSLAQVCYSSGIRKSLRNGTLNYDAQTSQEEGGLRK